MDASSNSELMKVSDHCDYRHHRGRDVADLWLSRDPELLWEARAWVMDYLTAVPVRGGLDLAPDLLLVVTELVTNAITHGAAPCVLRLSHSPDCLLVAVQDSSDDSAVRTGPRATADGGWGLELVDKIALAWGQFHQADAKIVWACLPLG